MEYEKCLLSSPDQRAPSEQKNSLSRDFLSKFLTELYCKLTEPINGPFCLHITSSFNFSYSGDEPFCKSARPLLNSHTPELLVEVGSPQYEALLKGNQICKVLVPRFDGKQHLQAISRVSGISIEMVKECASHLEFFGFLRINECFQFTNRFLPGPELPRAPRSQEQLFWKAVAESSCVKEVALDTDFGLEIGLAGCI
jgi:hypothetical protein